MGDRTRLTKAQTRALPCFGGCGKTWHEAGGGWFGPQEDAWYCADCMVDHLAPANGDIVVDSDTGEFRCVIGAHTMN